MHVSNMSWNDMRGAARDTAAMIANYSGYKLGTKMYPIPRGGVYAALLVQNEAKFRDKPMHLEIVETPEEADFFIDDILDTGKTRDRYAELYVKPFFSLFRKGPNLVNQNEDIWMSFPWERYNKEEGPEDNIVRLLQFIGENPEREGLRDTPSRVVRSYQEIYSGYKKNPEDVMKVFTDGACDEMVILKDIEFYSVCEHHMQPFFGKAHIAYIPDECVLGVSKLARVLDMYARRLQIQERLTSQVTEALMRHLKPKGAACVVEAKHFCMVCRGVGKQNSKMVTSSLLGAFRSDAAVRSEFLSMLKD